MEGRTHCHHQLKPMCYSGQRRRCGPGIERRLFRAFDIVQVEPGTQRKAEAEFFTSARRAADVRRSGLHLLTFHIAQPPTEDRKPVSVSHYRASFSKKATSRTS